MPSHRIRARSLRVSLPDSLLDLEPFVETRISRARMRARISRPTHLALGDRTRTKRTEHTAAHVRLQRLGGSVQQSRRMFKSADDTAGDSGCHQGTPQKARHCSATDDTTA